MSGLRKTEFGETARMADRRTVGEQAKSGLRIAAIMIFVFVFFLALVSSTGYLVGRNNGEMTGKPHPIGVLILLALAAFLYRTTSYWAPWLFGFLGYGFLRLLIKGLVFGPYLRQPASRTTIIWYLLYTAAAIALTIRYASRSPKGTERVGLVSFVVCVPFALEYQSYVPTLIGLGLLGIGELFERLRHRRRKSHKIAGTLPMQLV